MLITLSVIIKNPSLGQVMYVARDNAVRFLGLLLIPCPYCSNTYLNISSIQFIIQNFITLLYSLNVSEGSILKAEITAF